MAVDSILLNDFSGVKLEQRTRSSGRSVVQLVIKAEPIATLLNPVALGAGPAAALAKVIGQQIGGVMDATAPSTKLKRNYAEAAFARGAGWARRRYAGGRTGATPPNTDVGQRLFNDSGRLAKGIVAIPDKASGSWVIRGPANRLDPATFGSMADFERMLQRLVERVPALRNPLGEPAVNEAIRKSVVVAKGQPVEAGKQVDRILARLILDALRAMAAA